MAFCFHMHSGMMTPVGVKGNQLGPTWDGVLLKGDTAVLSWALGYSLGVTDVNKNSLSPPKTVGAW
jgi:hypothetical protein